MSKKILADQDFGGVSRILNLLAPVAAEEPVRKADLEAAIEGLKHKDPCRVSTQSNINLASPGSTIDGVTMVSGDRVLVRVQTTTSQNGIYTFNGAASAMTRTLDANTAAELNNALTYVSAGTDAGNGFRQTATVVTLGTDAVTWGAFGASAPSASETTPGIVELATQAEVNTGTDTSRAITPATLAAWSGRPLRSSGTFGDGAATQYDVTHSFGTRDVLVQVKRVGSPYDVIECEIEALDTNTVRLKFASAPTSNQFRVTVLA